MGIKQSGWCILLRGGDDTDTKGRQLPVSHGESSKKRLTLRHLDLGFPAPRPRGQAVSAVRATYPEDLSWPP